MRLETIVEIQRSAALLAPRLCVFVEVLSWMSLGFVCLMLAAIVINRVFMPDVFYAVKPSGEVVTVREAKFAPGTRFFRKPVIHETDSLSLSVVPRDSSRVNEDF